MGLLSWRNKGKPAPLQEPTISLPPPSKQARMQKESAWLSSIASRRSNPSETYTLPSSRRRPAAPVVETFRSGTPPAAFADPNLLSPTISHAHSQPDDAASIASKGSKAKKRSRFALKRQKSEGSIKSRAPSLLDENGNVASNYAFVVASPPPTTSERLVTGSSGATTNRRQQPAHTQTLAARLQELSVANEDGLLDDEEYRALREVLFERFAAAPIGQQDADAGISATDEAALIGGSGQLSLHGLGMRSSRYKLLRTNA